MNLIFCNRICFDPVHYVESHFDMHPWWYRWGRTDRTRPWQLEAAWSLCHSPKLSAKDEQPHCYAKPRRVSQTSSLLTSCSLKDERLRCGQGPRLAKSHAGEPEVAVPGTHHAPVVSAVDASRHRIHTCLAIHLGAWSWPRSKVLGAPFLEQCSGVSYKRLVNWRLRI